MLPLSLGHAGILQTGNASLVLVLVKATIILIGALVVTLGMQRAAASARHLVWLVTLGALLLIPALTVWAPIHLRILPAQPELLSGTASAQQSQLSVSQSEAAQKHAAGGTAIAPSTASSSNAVAADQTAGNAAITRLRNTDPLVILFAVWAAIALAIAASLAYATLSLHRVVVTARPLNDQDWLNAIWEVSDRLGLDRAPRLLQSSAVKMPFACGVLHPTIVLPLESDDWSPERRSAVLLHELAHVRRRDLMGHTLGRIACAVYWFHPLVWTAAKRLRSESERACDDLALTCGTHAADYAEHLLDIVTSVRGDRTPLVALAMARRKEFEGRMLAILDPQLRRSIPGPWKTTALVGSLGALSIVVGAAAPAPRAALPVSQHEVAVARKSISPATPAVRTAAAPAAGTKHDSHVSKTSAARDAAADAPRVEHVPVAAPHFPDGIVSSQNLQDLIARSVPPGSTDASSRTPDERAELLIKVLKTDASADIRHTAAWGLSRYAKLPAASDALAAALQHDASADVREIAAWSLAYSRGAGASVVQALDNALVHDASDSVRATSAWSLGLIRDRASVEPLTTALADRSAGVRARAVWALGMARPKPAPAALVSKLSDTNPKVRELTAWSLFMIRDPATIPALQSALRTETDHDLQIDYIRALASMGDSSIDAIRGMLESSDPKIKSMAVNALAGGGATGPWPWPWPDPRPFP